MQIVRVNMEYGLVHSDPFWARLCYPDRHQMNAEIIRTVNSKLEEMVAPAVKDSVAYEIDRLVFGEST